MLVNLGANIGWRISGSTLAFWSGVAKECRYDFGQVAQAWPIGRTTSMNKVRITSGLIAPASRQTPRATFKTRATRSENGSGLPFWATFDDPLGRVCLDSYPDLTTIPT